LASIEGAGDAERWNHEATCQKTAFTSSEQEAQLSLTAIADKLRDAGL